MGKNVWGYWDCPYCGTKKIRGDKKLCPNCGIQIPADTRFYIAPAEGVEYVSEGEKNDLADWICEYCDTQNNALSEVCKVCGAPRSDAQRDYFGNGLSGGDENADSRPPPTSEPAERTRHFDRKKLFKRLRIAVIILLIVSFFIPITRTSEITGFCWERSIQIEEYNNYDESDWTLPQGANLHYSAQEIHHYTQILDHYEKRTRQVSREEFDGYDTDYIDKGNGQFEEVQTPRYRTVWETEEYEEPVYKNVPVFQTKYYYDIDRWKNSYTVDTHGSDHDAVWGELPSAVIKSEKHTSPQYGDERENGRSGKYYVNVSDTKHKAAQRIEYPESEWNELEYGEKITYKTFWWSSKPL